MKYGLTMMVVVMVGSAVNASPILWDITKSSDGNSVDAVVADFTAAGVKDDLTGATVSIVNGSGTTMSDVAGITLDYLIGSAINVAVNGADMSGVAGSSITKEYLYIRENGLPIIMRIGGLTNSLAVNTDYSFYIWGVGDELGQASSFAFGGITNAIVNVDPDINSADNFVAEFSFSTGATVSDTLDFEWDRTDALSAGLNGFAIVEAIPEPGTLGLIAVFGGGMLFARRRFKR